MKRKFVTCTLTLSLLLIAAAPAQVFAGTKCEGQVRNSGNVVRYSQYNQNCSQKNYNSNSNAVKSASANCDTVKSARASANANCDTVKSANANANCNTVKSANANCNTYLADYLKNCDSSLKNCTIKVNGCPTIPVNPSTPAVPETSNTPAVPEKSTTQEPGGSISDYEQQVVDLVNKERAAAGLSPLKLNTKLSGVAEKKAEDMRDKNYFSHTSPTYGSPFDMMSQFGIKYTSAGENIAKGQRTPASVMSGWMNSPGHKANIMNTKYDQIGVGYVTDSNGNTYWVQMFIK